MHHLTLGFLTVLLGGLATAPAAWGDILELKDGRLIEGVVVEAKDVYVVHSRFGVGEIPVKDVKRREKAASVDAQIRAHLKKLDSDDQASRAVLARWLKKLGRADEALALAEAVLEEDPQSAVAHEVLGHVRHQGVWRTPDQAKRAEGLERHGDRWYTPAEWANVTGEARKTVLEAEKKQWQHRVDGDVNRAVQLMLSPDPKLRARGRTSLDAMAEEYKNPSLKTLAGHVEAYAKKLDDLRDQQVRAAAAGAPGGRSGMVYPELRATMSRLKRPIQEFQTSLASSLGGAGVRIQLPELEVIDVRTMVGIPAVIR